MSELDTEQKQEDVAPVIAPAAVEQVSADQPKGLTADQENVLWNLQVLEDGDYKLLAQVLANYPEMREQIIQAAVGHMGNDTIAKALQVLAGVPEPEAPSEKAAADAPPAAAPGGAGPAKEQAFDYTTSPLALEYDEKAKEKDHVDFMVANPQVADQVLAQTAALDLGLALHVAEQYHAAEAQPKAEAAPQQEETPPQVIEETSKAAAEEVKAEKPKTEEAAQPVAAQEAVEAKPLVEPEKESGWVVRARGWNADHADDVARFLAATGGACMVDGVLDPNLVAQWQSRHGVSVDGRIGEATVDAAVKQQPQSHAEAAKEAQEEQLPEPDPTDPKFAF